MVVLLAYAFIIEPKYSSDSKPVIKKVTTANQTDFETGDKIIKELQEKHGDLLYNEFMDKEDFGNETELDEKSLSRLQEFTDSEDSKIIDALEYPEEPIESEPVIKEKSVISFRIHKDQLKKVKASRDDEFSSFIKNTKLQNELWQRFAHLVPVENREMIKRFKVMTDGADNTLGYVQQMYDENYWELALDYKDAENLKDLYATLIHEFGHLFSLNSSEYTKNKDCSTDKLLDVCYKQNTYIYDFYQQFWQDDLIDEWPGTSASEDELIDFYDAHFDEFVSDYATTDVIEDFAESWMYFILIKKPKSKEIADDKILFFYQYPELVQLRNTLLKNLSEHYK